jgi:putative nucleotidyltransferase with HDIG domain
VNGDRVIQCNIRDVSDRKKNEALMLAYQTLTNVSMREMIRTLSKLIEFKDPYTADHQSRVADLAVAIANEIELPLHTVEGIRMSAMVHDIGKIGIPAEILTKPTPLTNYELAMVQSHAEAGYEIVKHIHFPWPLAMTVHQHHERLDGSGYPKGLSGDDIIEEARILAVADTVEAMSSNRPYRIAPGLETALKTIKDGSGTLFDPKVVKACLTLFEKKNYSFSNAIV